MLRKGGSNWVEGDQFFNREAELEALEERVRHGTHTLLTAQRRMGKTSLVRELLRRLERGGEFETIFVDLETAADPADAVAEISVQAKTARGALGRIRARFTNVLQVAGSRIGELSLADLKVKQRSGRQVASLDDVECIYVHEMLGVRGQVDLQHYEGRLETILGRTGYPIALELLTATAAEGRLDGDTVDRNREYFSDQDKDGAPSVEDVLHVLRHDGYLDHRDDAYGFESGFLEDWWLSRYGQHFVSILELETHARGNRP